MISILKPYFVFLGDHVHKLFYDTSGKNVEVKRYTRRKNYNTDSITYSCLIWSVNTAGYQPSTLTFAYPALATYNWNYLDHLICGYQDQMTDALRYWRIRFLLIPSENPPLMSNSNGSLSDEEERVEGFKKFMEIVEKARYFAAHERDELQNRKLDIQLTTLNLSSLVKAEKIHSLLPEAFSNNIERTSKPKAAPKLLNKFSSTDSIAKSIFRSAPEGLVFQDRLWHSEIYPNISTGEEVVDWIMQSFADVNSRQEAIEVGNSLLIGNVIQHVNQKQSLLDGFYFYKPCTEWTHLLNTADQNIDSHHRFQPVRQINLDLDPSKKSSRLEIAHLHYDTTHNSKNCYHFQLHWLVCTARLVEDLLYQWARMADKTGFKLVEVPGRQVSHLH
jgi:hypothetical protein